MSETITPKPAEPAAPSRLASIEPSWAKPAIAVFNLGLFVAAMVLVLVFQNAQALQLLIGAIIANSTTVINYYFGSSAGSDRKTELMTPPT